MKFTLATLLLASTASVYAAVGLKELVVDLHTLDTSATSLLKQLNAIDGSDLVADLKVDKAAKALTKSIKSTTADAKAFKGTVTTIDAEGAIDELKNTQATAKKICARLVKLKPAFDDVGATDIVAGDVQDIVAAINKLGPAFIALDPKESRDQAEALFTSFKKTIKVCSDAYPASS